MIDGTCEALGGILTIIPSVMKRIAPPRTWRMKNVAGRPRSLARSQQPNTLSCPEKDRDTQRSVTPLDQSQTHAQALHLGHCRQRGSSWESCCRAVLDFCWSKAAASHGTSTQALLLEQEAAGEHTDTCTHTTDIQSVTHKGRIVHQVNRQHFLSADSVYEPPLTKKKQCHLVLFLKQFQL